MLLTQLAAAAAIYTQHFQHPHHHHHQQLIFCFFQFEQQYDPTHSNTYNGTYTTFTLPHQVTYEMAKTTMAIFFWYVCVCVQMITNWIVFAMSSVDIFKMIIETTNWLYARFALILFSLLHLFFHPRSLHLASIHFNSNVFFWLVFY